MSYLTRRIGVRIVFLASIICVANVFAGDDIAEIEAALARDTVRELGPKTNTRSLLGVSVNNDNNIFWATGELNIVRGGPSGGTIDLYFDVPLSYISVSSIKVTMNAYDVDYPRSAYSDVEHDKVYFNGAYIGRLRGGDVVWQENTFEVPKELLTTGRNYLHIDVNVEHTQAWVTSIGWAKLVVDGYVMELSASDGEDSHGIKVSWDDVGGPYTLYRAVGKNGDFKPIPGAESLDKNSYTDTNIKYGQAYWYYVATSSNQTSSNDSGYAKIDSDEPRIESIKCASLWLTGEGPYNMRLYWNDFDGDMYELDQITFVLSGGALNRSNNYIALYKFSDQPLPCSFTDIDLTDYLEERLPRDSRYFKWGRVLPNGEHGPYSITAFLVCRDRRNGQIKGMMTNARVNVYFPKFGKSSGISNWYRFWPRDGAISYSGIVQGVHPPQRGSGCPFDVDDGCVYFLASDKDLGKSCNLWPTERLEYGELPIIGLSGYKARHIAVSDLCVTHGQEFKIEPLNTQNEISVGCYQEKGIYRFAQDIVHEKKHWTIHKDFYNHMASGNAIIFRKSGVGGIYRTIDELISAAENINPRTEQLNRYIFKLHELKNSGHYILDSDGDDIPNYFESEGRYGRETDPFDSDSLKLARKNNRRNYEAYGDNEAFAREVESSGNNLVVERKDWSFPGCNVAKEYMGYYNARVHPNIPPNEVWSGEVESTQKRYLQNDCFNLRSTRNLRFLAESSVSGMEYQIQETCESGSHNEMPEFAVSDTQYPISMLKVEALEVVLSARQNEIRSVPFKVAITNLCDRDIYCSVCGIVTCASETSAVWARRNILISAFDAAECVLDFDATLLSKADRGNYRLNYIEIVDAESDIFTWSVNQICDVGMHESAYSSDFAKPAIKLISNISDAKVDDCLHLSIPVEINKANDYMFQTTLEGTNSAFVCATSVSGHFDVGETTMNLVFDGASIRRSGIDGPYQVPSIRVLSYNEVVAETEGFYITNEYNANDFGAEPTMLLVDGSSWQREADIIGADGLIDELRFGIVATNTLPDAVAYRVHAILKGANNYPAAVYSEEVQLVPGENALMVSFSGSDILSSGVGGPYYVSEVSFSPAGEAGEEAYARINMEPLEIVEGAFGGKSFTITGEISVTENPGRGIAARVDIPLNVMRIGEVEASLLVIDTNGTCVATFSTNVTISATGEQILKLELSPDIILAYELGGGEYDIRALVLESANGNDSETIPFVCSGLVYRIGEEIFSYEEIPDGVAITGIDKAIAGNLVRADIPESICGRPVTGIETNAFRNCTNLVGVVIPDIVASIGASAFYNCKSLTNVDIPASVTNIAVSAFRSSGVMSFFVDEDNPTYSSQNGLLLSKDGKVLIIGINGDVVIPDSVTSIGDYAFYECRGLTSVTIGNNVTSIGNWAFCCCSRLISITIPDSVISIGDSVFIGCKLKSITVPQCLCNGNENDISERFFHLFSYSYASSASYYGRVWQGDGSMDNIEDIIISDTVTNIGANAFSYCRGLKSVFIGGNVTSIGVAAFYECTNLTSVAISASVMNISKSAFEESGIMSFVVADDNPIYSAQNGLLLSRDGKNLIVGVNGDVVIPDSVTSIGGEAFSCCRGLTRVTIGPNVTDIGDGVFSSCSGLTAIIVDEDNKNYMSANGLLLSKNGEMLIQSINGSGMIPDSVTSIEGKAFAGCTNLTSVSIPDSVTSIGWGAFSGCSGLTSVTIGNSVTNIGEWAFGRCSGLTCVTIPDGVTSIGDAAFQSCSNLKKVMIGDGLMELGVLAFNGCTKLTEIVFEGNAPKVDYLAFHYINPDCTAYVRIDSKGWGVEIPGTWNGIKIDYLPYETVNVVFNLYPGEEGFESESLSIPKDVNATLFLPTPKRKGYKFIGWFTEAEGGSMIVDGDVLSEDTTLYAHWEELLLLNTGTDNVIWDGTAINESNFDFTIPATEDLPAGTVVGINRITFASLNDSFTAWDVDTNKSDPYTVYLNGVKSDAYVFGGTIASNVGTLDNAISYTFSEPCDIVVGKRYPAVKGNNYGTVGNGIALMHSNSGGVLVYGGGADRASVRYVKTGDGNSIMSTPTAKQITGVSGYHPVYEIQYDIVGIAPSGLDKLAFEYTATSANHTIKSIPDGWFKGATRFADETIQKSNLRIGSGGDFKYALQTTASLSPWRDMDARTNAFSFALYADISAMALDAKAVMVAIGNRDGYSAILYRESGFVKLGFVDVNGGIVGEAASVEFVSGFHLYTAICDPISGALTLNVDGAAHGYGAAGGSVVLGNGFQIGSVYYGCPYGFSRGANMAIVKMLGYDAELLANDIAVLAAEYPAVESLVCDVGQGELDGKTLTVTTNQTARVIVTAEQEREGCEAANIYVKDGGDLVFVDEGGEELVRSRVVADGEMRSLIGSDSLGVKTASDAVVVVESNGAYIITAVGDSLIDAGSISARTALDGEIIDVDVNAGYVVEISVDGKYAVLSLRKPVIGCAAGEDGASSDDNDPSGVLVEVAEEKISAKPKVGEGEVVGALPVKAVRGLYYQAAWGDDLRELRPGEKVQAKDVQLYLGVIKQDGDSGFYRLSVSEK